MRPWEARSGLAAALLLLPLALAPLPAGSEEEGAAAASAGVLGPQPHAPILIVGDAEFNSANGVVGGNGTALSPYRIANWSIDAISGSALVVRNTRAHFAVEDCVIASRDSAASVVYFENVTNAAVRRADIRNGSDQLVLSLSSSVYVGETNLSGNGSAGARVHDSTDVTFDGLEIRGAAATAVEVLYGAGFTLSASRLSGNAAMGLYAVGAAGLKAMSSTVSDGGSGLVLELSPDALLRGNDLRNLSGDGITLLGSKNASVERNTVTDADVGIWSLTFEGGDSERDRILGNVVEAARRGIWLSQAVDSLTESNTVRNSTEHGIVVESSPGARLTGNRVEGSRWGLSVVSLGPSRAGWALDIDSTNTVDGREVYYALDVRDPVVPAGAGYVGLVNASGNLTAPSIAGQGEGLLIAVSDGLAVSGGRFTDNDRGIVVAASSNISLDSSVIERARSAGLAVTDSSGIAAQGLQVNDSEFTGVSVKASAEVLVNSSTIDRSGIAGISVDGSSRNVAVKWNRIRGNALGAEVREAVLGTLVYGNEFSSNAAHARDDGLRTAWNTSAGGNYWGGFSAPDLGCDGILDNPYPVPVGTSGSRDLLPLVKPPWGSVPPCAPGKPTVSYVGGAAAIKWSQPKWDGDAPVAGYRILRGVNAGSQSEVGASGIAEFADAGVLPNSTYYYAVRAENSAGLGPQSPVARLETVPTPAPFADLAAAWLKAEPARVPSGEEVRLRLRVENRGNVRAPTAGGVLLANQSGVWFTLGSGASPSGTLSPGEGFDVVVDAVLSPGKHRIRGLTQSPGWSDALVDNDLAVVEVEVGEPLPVDALPLPRSPWDAFALLVSLVVLLAVAGAWAARGYRPRRWRSR
jgi:parallel beta-helix repeat protein